MFLGKVLSIRYTSPYAPRPRRKKKRLVFLQLPLFFEGDGVQR